MRLLCFLLIAIFVLFSSPVSAGVYYYRDKSGVLHFTDSVSDIPQDQLPDARRYGKEDKRPMPEEPETSPEQKDEGPGKGKETGKKAEEGDRIKEGKEIPIVERLKKEKAFLDAEHSALMEKREELKKTKPTLNSPEKVRAYQKAMSELNERAKAYNERNGAFQKEADAYNSAIKSQRP